MGNVEFCKFDDGVALLLRAAASSPQPEQTFRRRVSIDNKLQERYTKNSTWSKVMYHSTTICLAYGCSKCWLPRRFLEYSSGVWHPSPPATLNATVGNVRWTASAFVQIL
ncbi:hypothetical protein NA56DRAFT_711814 [Hyaloscypha hepaticicola]|uniref:Uncharacterized protein n=1 Tax=Hyaloscypha hepaticicola TaxID=2082293 RepID=A0A2J6PHY1_9HELO|nr:hypothetical protein NA56DRAFT_711814 [Hyaloscypha hepaticicola]